MWSEHGSQLVAICITYSPHILTMKGAYSRRYWHLLQTEVVQWASNLIKTPPCNMGINLRGFVGIVT